MKSRKKSLEGLRIYLATLLADLITSYEAISHWKILAYAKILGVVIE
ncbi:hypothetical protein DB42_AN00050 [Neochlamydia sp. EPS4]|nr:hypothetical protein [Neochlamydia sp. EPS4]KIC75150.1 hypothetical protein DB42_AN00050 [Neochlamydia sp. EPS4]